MKSRDCNLRQSTQSTHVHTVKCSSTGSALKHSNASSKPGRTTPKGDTRVTKAGSHMRSESCSDGFVDDKAIKGRHIRKS